MLEALAFRGRGENKDAYDLYYVVRNYGAGIADVGPRRVAEFLVRGPDADIQADVVGFVKALVDDVS